MQNYKLKKFIIYGETNLLDNFTNITKLDLEHSVHDQ